MFLNSSVPSAIRSTEIGAGGGSYISSSTFIDHLQPFQSQHIDMNNIPSTVMAQNMTQPSLLTSQSVLQYAASSTASVVTTGYLQSPIPIAPYNLALTNTSLQIPSHRSYPGASDFFNTGMAATSVITPNPSVIQMVNSRSNIAPNMLGSTSAAITNLQNFASQLAAAVGVVAATNTSAAMNMSQAAAALSQAAAANLDISTMLNNSFLSNTAPAGCNVIQPPSLLPFQQHSFHTVSGALETTPTLPVVAAALANTLPPVVPPPSIGINRTGIAAYAASHGHLSSALGTTDTAAATAPSMISAAQINKFVIFLCDLNNFPNLHYVKEL